MEGWLEGSLTCAVAAEVGDGLKVRRDPFEGCTHASLAHHVRVDGVVATLADLQ